MLAPNNGSFWKLSKGAQVSMWLIGIIFAILMFVFGRESIKSTVWAQAVSIKTHTVQIEQVRKDVDELKITIRENQKEITDELKMQRQLINDIHSAVKNK